MPDQEFPFLTQATPGVLHFGGARMALLEIESGFWSIRRQMEALIGARLTNSVLQQAGANGGASFASSFFSEKIDERSSGFQTCLQAYEAAGFGRFEIDTMDWPLGCVIIRARDTFEAWMTSRHGQSSVEPVCAYTAGVLVGFINTISNRQDVVCIERNCQAQGAQACEFELLPAGQTNSQEQVVAFNPDPGMSRQINLLEMLFERMPMGIAVIDNNFILRRVNPTWAAFIDQYTPSQSVDVLPGTNIFELEPGTEEILVPLFNRVFDGETVRQEAVRIESGGIASYWDIVLSPLYENGQVVGLLNVSIDATERIQAEQRLKETLARLTESESMLRSVIENAQHFAIYRVLIDKSNPYGGKVMLASPSLRELTGVEHPYNFEKWFENLHPDDYPRIVEANRRLLEEGIVYSQPARFFNVKEDRWRWVQTISNPGFDAEGRLTHFDGMVIDLTEQKEAELALQETLATLEQRVDERTQEVERRRKIAESLRDILGMINSNMPLDIILDRAVKLAMPRLGASGCTLHHFDLENQLITHKASYGMPGEYKKGITLPFADLGPLGGDDYLQAALQQQPTFGNYRPLAERLEEIERDTSIPKDIQAQRVELRKKFAGSLAVPLVIQDQTYGGMVFYYTAPQDFSDEQVQLAMTFAEQVALAIENARLHQSEQARQRELQMLLDVAAAANSSLNLDEMLATTLDRLVALVGASRAGVALLGEATGRLEARLIRPERAVSPEDLAEMIRACEHVMVSGEALFLAPDAERGLIEPGALLPLKARGRFLGVLVIVGLEGGSFDPGQLALFKSIADQLSVAVENASLYEQAEHIAVAQERNRLARDLHDAVTQTLFSASLIADVLPKLWERNPQMGNQKLEELKLLTRGALSEMRTLLLELRPDTLAEVELGDLYRHLANAFSGRTRLPVVFTQEGQSALPPDVKEAFYRVAQEALNNIAKHARASQVQVHLTAQDDQAEVSIRDDGCGFDVFAISAENLGLKIMRERTEAVHAELDIESAPGAGTQIRLRWRAIEEQT